MAASLVVARRRESGPLALDLELALVVLAADLGPGLLIFLTLGDVELRRLVGRRGHLIGVVVVEPGLDPLLLGQAGQLVVVEALQLAGMLAAVAVELLRRLVWVLLCNDATVAPARPAAGVGSIRDCTTHGPAARRRRLRGRRTAVPALPAARGGRRGDGGRPR